MSKKGLTYLEVIAYAEAHYKEGGDIIVECWDETFYNMILEMSGKITRKDLDAVMRVHLEEIKAAKYFGGM